MKTEYINTMPEKNEGSVSRVPFLRPAYCLLLIASSLLLTLSCSNYYKNDYKDNSPTSGKLKVYFDEGIRLHVKNQAQTFEAHYPAASLDLFETTESDAIKALFNDSCEAIVISRLLNNGELKAFQSKQITPNYSEVAKTGLALLTNFSTPVNAMNLEEIKELLAGKNVFKDTTNAEITIRALLDKNNSAVMHFVTDSILGGKKFSSSCNVLNSSLESINYVATHSNTIAFIDFAWLSDSDDSVYKANHHKLKFIGITSKDGKSVEYPSQSSFKLDTYPFTRTLYVMRKTGDFTLAKGFESFVAGPKGQLTFLKQGLLPHRQSERSIEVKFEPMKIQ